MGRALLIAAALCAAFGCARPPEQVAAHAGKGHESLTCAACHGNTMQVTASTARVSDATCTKGGCHEDRGPADVQLARVRFRHRQHGGGPIQATCAGCHMHPMDTRDKTLASRGEACALCHADQLAGKRSADCRACHADPAHVPVSSQGVPIPHSSLPIAETGCLRCHYDVSAPRTTVSTSRCASCHTGEKEGRRGVGEDLHPAHAGVGCTGCHEGMSHRVVSMSSAVVLDCRDCHGAAHGIALASLGNPSATCNGCHAGSHQAQQRLILGQVPGMPPEPSMKFIAGMMCRSCHTPPGRAMATGARPVRGAGSACVGCHRPEYAQVLQWWIQGTRARGDAVSAYLRQAETSLGSSAPDSSRRLLASVREALSVVANGGGQHNLDLSDAIFREGVVRVRSAYAIAGRSAPPAPALGSEPHVGFCSYCHYSSSERWEFGRMPADFHRQVMDTARITAAESPAR